MSGSPDKLLLHTWSSAKQPAVHIAHSTHTHSTHARTHTAYTHPTHTCTAHAHMHALTLQDNGQMEITAPPSTLPDVVSIDYTFLQNFIYSKYYSLP